MNKIYSEGDKCPDKKCNGELEYPDVEGCSCHINPPCRACIENELICSECFCTVEESEAGQ